MQLQIWATQRLGKAKATHPPGLGQPEGTGSGPALPIPLASYHVIHKAFIDRDEECLVGELIIQEIQEVKTARSSIGIAQQHLKRWGDRAVSRLPPQGFRLPHTPQVPAHPIEGGEVDGGGQYIKQLPVAHAGPITHKAVTAPAGHVWEGEFSRSVDWRNGQSWTVRHGGVAAPCTR